MAPSSHNKTKVKNYIKQYLYMFLVTLKWFVIVLFLGGLMVGGVAFGYATALVKDEPIRSKEHIISRLYDTTVSGYIYFDDDTLIGRIRSDEDRTLIALKDIPQKVIDAFLAIEDNDFYEHPGMDLKAFLRAARQQLLNEPIQTGGSTITQQVTKLTFFTDDVTNERKAKEILLALRLERYLSKDQILEIYLNKISFGRISNGYYTSGIRTAASGIFNIDDLNELNSAQAAYLAGLPQSPSQYSAYTTNGSFNESGFNKAMDRQRLVLKRMYEEEKLTYEEYQEALAFDIKASLAPTRKKAYTTYPFLMLEAERKAAEALVLASNPHFTAADLRDPENAELVYQSRERLRGGYKIYTTINKTIYDAMQDIAQDPDNFLPEHEEKGIEQVGMIMLDNKTSAIISMIEGRDFYVEQLNHATQMIRQPGSAMKPIAAFLPALEQGLIQPATSIDDTPMIMPDGSKGYHLPNNVNNRFAGIMTARHALNHSFNIPALKLFNDVVGIDKAWEFTKSLGITTITEQDYQSRTGVIGGLTYGTTVEELTNAFATIANGGQFNDAYMIRRIEDAEGNIIFEHNEAPARVFSEQTAYLMTDMLRTALGSGTGGSVRRAFDYYNEVPIAGKTGTTQNWHDVWFVGYSPDISIGVWVGYDQPSPLLTAQGAQHRAKEIWTKVINKTIELKPDEYMTSEFERPDGIVSLTVSSVSGMIPSPLVKEANMLVTDLFNRAFIPEKEDDVLRRMKFVVYNNMNYIPLSTTPDDMIREDYVIRRTPPLSSLLSEIEEALDSMADHHRPRKGGAFMTMADYMPADIRRAEATEIDPRVDDGLIPEPPTNLVLTQESETQNKITFDWSTSPDVVGYRFYRSFDGRPFVYAPSQNILVGDSNIIIDGVSSQYDHAYYLTAVDIAGNESAPSMIVTTSNNASDIPSPILPSLPDPNDQDDEDDEHDENRSDTDSDNDNGAGGEQDDVSARLPASPKNVSISTSPASLFIEVSWDANASTDHILRYHIYFSEEQDGEFEYLGSSNTTRYSYLATSSEGWYYVVAENNNGVSPPSHIVSH